MAARAARVKLALGIDPVEDSRAARSRLIADQATAVTFSQAAIQYIETHEGGWRNTKHVQQWSNTLETYANSVIGRMLVRGVESSHVLAVLEPIRRTKTERASRLRGRIESVLDWATARGYREGNNPARWKGHLDQLLPASGKIAKQDHHPSLPYVDLPAFMQALSLRNGIGARAPEFAILTAARSDEVRGTTWREFDLDGKVWTIPAEQMKAAKEHRIPLSTYALAIIADQKKHSFCDYVFRGPMKGSPTSGQQGSTLSAKRPVARPIAHPDSS